MNLQSLMRLASIGAGASDKVSLLASGLASRLSVPVTVRVVLGGRPVRVTIHDGADRTVLREIGQSCDYAAAQQPDPPVIVDVGANVGFAALYFAGRFPEATIHAIEPSPRTYEKLVRNTAGHSNIHTHNLGIGATDGTATFYSYPMHFASSFRERHGRGGGEAQPVRVSTLSSFLAEQGIAQLGLLKIDVEGYETEVLLGTDLSRVAQVIVELHHDLMTAPEAWFLERLSRFSVEVVDTMPRRSIIFARSAT